MTAKELDLWARFLGFVDETLAEVRKSYKELSGEDFAADSRIVTAGWAGWYERSSTVRNIAALTAIGVGPIVLKLSPPRSGVCLYLPGEAGRALLNARLAQSVGPRGY